MLKKLILVKQDELKDCGPACIATLIKYYQGNIPLEQLKDMCHTTKKGTTALDIVLTLKSIGFKAEGIKIDLKGLTKITLPCIAHITIDEIFNHYVVIYKINIKKKILIVGDPKDRIKKMTFQNFDKIWNNIIINAYPIKSIPVIYNRKDSLFVYIFKTLNCYKKSLFLILVLSSLMTLFMILLSFNLQYMIDGITNLKSLEYFTIGFSFFLFIVLIKISCDFLRNKTLIYLNNKIDASLTNNVFKNIICLPYHYYHNKTTGEIVSRINELGKVKQLISKVSLSLFLDLPLTFLSLLVLFYLNFTLTLIALIIVLCYLLLIIWFKPKHEKYINDLQNENAEISTYMIENIRAFKTVKGLNIENNVNTGFNQKYSKLIKTNFKFENYANGEYFFKELINNIGTLTVISLGTILVLNQELTLGQLMSFNTLLMYFLLPLRNIVDLDTDIREAKNALKKVNNLLVDLKNKTSDKRITKGEISFNKLSFSFNKRDMILKDINFNIKAGSKNLLIGKSGSGKSTLCMLLMKFYPVPNNQVYLDKLDINKYGDVREDIVYISQNELLFTDTIYNNIALGREFDNDEFMKVVKLCEVDQIIDKNIGYNELIEENGFNLSGGEKQKIVLARALMKKFSILIIDEGLNQMDFDLEKRILEKIFKTYSDKTIIVISHRLTNKKLFEQIIELKKGRLIKTTNLERVVKLKN